MKFAHIARSNGRMWFRLLGYGLSFSDRTKHKAPFSERNGFVKVLRIGKWSVKLLKP